MSWLAIIPTCLAKIGILAPYKVVSWSNIPADAKAADGTWFADYGGYVAIGYNSDKVKTAPTSFADLLKPEYKNQVAINGNPTQAGAAFSAVFASALANGGSLDNISPGIAYFKKLHSVGNVPDETAVDVLVRPEGLHMEIVEYGNGIVTTRTFLGSVTGRRPAVR